MGVICILYRYVIDIFLFNILFDNILKKYTYLIYFWCFSLSLLLLQNRIYAEKYIKIGFLLTRTLLPVFGR